MAKLPAKHGRTVIKNEYEAEYQRMRAKAQTLEYAAVRKEHPKIERKLSELVRRHGARRAAIGAMEGSLWTTDGATAANIKRIVHSLRTPTLALAEE